MTFDAEPGWGLFAAPELRQSWSPLLHFGLGAESVSLRSGGGLVYVATPYSREVARPGGGIDLHRHAEASVRAALVCARIAAQGATAVSPIVLSCAMVDAGRRLDPLDEKFWTRWCAPLLSASSAVYVPDIPGWQRSRGIWHEVCWALTRNVTVMIEAEGV